MNEPAREVRREGSPGGGDPELGPLAGWATRLRYRRSAAPVYWLALSAGLLLICVLLPPRTLTVRDEANYLGVARFLLDTGSLRATESPARLDGLVPWFETKPGGTAPIHPLGVSLLIAPLMAVFGWKGAFFFQMMTFALGGWVFWKLLPRYQVPPWFGLLYFLFPPFLLYSRVCMADLPSAVLCLLGFFFLVRPQLEVRNGFLGGVVLGIAFLVRPANAIFIGPLAVYALYQAWQGRRLLPALLLGGTGALFFSAQLGLNAYFLGSPFVFSYATDDMFSPSNFGPNLLFYLIVLSTMFPLMVAGLWSGWRDGHRLEVSVVVAGVLFYSWYAYADRDGGPLVYVIRGQRFLLPYVAVLLLLYARLLSRVRWIDRLGQALYLPLLVLPLIGSVAVARAQEQMNASSEAARRWVYGHTVDGERDAIVYNADSCEFVHGIFGARRYYRMRSGQEFPSTWSQAAATADRIVVVETDHRHRRGQPYASSLIREGWHAGFRVTDSATLGRIVLVLLERY